MAVSPINISRVTLRSNLTMDSLRANQREVFINQSRISSGRSFAVPSENPAAASQAFGFHNLLARQLQLTQNIQLGGSVLREADNAINEVNALLIDAQTIASQNLSNLTTADERAAAAELVAAIRQQLITVGNRTFNGRYIFAGRQTQSAPFVDALGGVAYLGDTGRLDIRVSQGLLESINIPGNELFGALSSSVAGLVDLSPDLTEDVRLEDLRGATGRGIRRGQLIFTEKDKGSFSADISGADTIGDVVAIINEAATQAGAGLTASLSSDGLIITPSGFEVSITDPGNGVIASGLGIRTLDPSSEPITGRSLNPRLTMLTPVEALSGGDAIDLDSGLLVTNGVDSTTIDLSGAATVQDVINTINNAGVFVHARISEDGTRIDVFNQVSGSSLRIGENGGTTASDLGIRTFDSATSLDRLNFGRGVTVVSGEDDFRITTKDGSTVDVNLDTARTIGDVITLINDAATKEAV
ncbi:MAG: hypothetical protein IIB59_03905, partial [Planctomycetes bacterium]|nr:hypothetical protein [Planctomycetota bacterium]